MGNVTLPDTCQAAVFDGVGQPIRMATFPLVEPPAGHVLAKVRMATICGSDLHSVSGRRIEPAPSILGHEIVAQVVELGEGVSESANGAALEQGDRVTFTIMASCGGCENCRAGLPQKCESLFKYGHTRIGDGLALSGGYAEYLYLRPGTGIFHVPTELSDKEVCPANCALATVINGLETIEVNAGDRVLVQGCGLLGLYCTMLLKERNVSEIVVTDVADGRLDAPLLTGDAFQPGDYMLEFEAGDYYRRLGMILPEPAFLDTVVIAFGISDRSSHYHVPLLISPYGYSTYRGS